MLRSKALKDSSRGFQVSSEISFLISVRKTLPTSGHKSRFDIQKFLFLELNGLLGGTPGPALMRPFQIALANASNYAHAVDRL